MATTQRGLDTGYSDDINPDYVTLDIKHNVSRIKGVTTRSESLKNYEVSATEMSTSQRSLGTGYSDDINPDSAPLDLKHTNADEEPNVEPNRKKPNRKRTKKKQKKGQPLSTSDDQLEESKPVEDMETVKALETFGNEKTKGVCNRKDNQLSDGIIKQKCDPGKDFAGHSDNNNYMLPSQISETVPAHQKIENTETQAIQLPSRRGLPKKGMLFSEVVKKKKGVTKEEERGNTYHHWRTSQDKIDFNEQKVPAGKVSVETASEDKTTFNKDSEQELMTAAILSEKVCLVQNMIGFNKSLEKQNDPVENFPANTTSLDSSLGLETGKNKRRKKPKSKKQLSPNPASLVNDMEAVTRESKEKTESVNITSMSMDHIAYNQENGDKLPSNESDRVCGTLTVQETELSPSKSSHRDNSINETCVLFQSNELLKNQLGSNESDIVQAEKTIKNKRRKRRSNTASFEKTPCHDNTGISSNKETKNPTGLCLEESLSTAEKMVQQNTFDTVQTNVTEKKKQKRRKIKKQPNHAFDSTLLLNDFATVTRDTTKKNDTNNATIPMASKDIADCTEKDDCTLPLSNDAEVVHVHPAMQSEESPILQLLSRDSSIIDAALNLLPIELQKHQMEGRVSHILHTTKAKKNKDRKPIALIDIADCPENEKCVLLPSNAAEVVQVHPEMQKEESPIHRLLSSDSSIIDAALELQSMELQKNPLEANVSNILHTTNTKKNKEGKPKRPTPSIENKSVALNMDITSSRTDHDSIIGLKEPSTIQLSNAVLHESTAQLESRKLQENQLDLDGSKNEHAVEDKKNKRSKKKTKENNSGLDSIAMPSDKTTEMQNVPEENLPADKGTQGLDTPQTVETITKKQRKRKTKTQSSQKPGSVSATLNDSATVPGESTKKRGSINIMTNSLEPVDHPQDDKLRIQPPDLKIATTHMENENNEAPVLQLPSRGSSQNEGSLYSQVLQTKQSTTNESRIGQAMKGNKKKTGKEKTHVLSPDHTSDMELALNMEKDTEMESDDGFDDEGNDQCPRHLSSFPRSTGQKTITNYEQSCREYSGISNYSASRKFDTSILQHGINLSEECINRTNIDAKWTDFYKEDISVQEMENLCERKPDMYKKCTIKIESPHLAMCKPLDSSDEIQEVTIDGRCKCGRAFTEDKVVVQITNLKSLNDSNATHTKKDNSKKEKEKVYGEVVGTLERVRHKDVEHPVYVCVIDDNEGHLMKPLCKTVPKIHIKHTRVKYKHPNTKQHKVELYRHDNDKGVLTFKEICDIEPADRQKYIFLVAFIRWNVKSVYPLGAVIKVLLSEEDIDTGLEIIGLQHQVPSLYTKQTIDNVQEILEQMHNGEIPPSLLADRRNLSHTLEVFTIDPPHSKDLDDALSIERLKNAFKVGVHIADVSSIVKKDDPICKEARERGVSYYPGQSFPPFHMLPEPLSEDLCSLLPGKERLTFSIFFKFDLNGRLIERPEIQKTVVKSVKKLSYKDAWDIIVDQKNPTTKLQKDIKDLYYLALGLRKFRLKNASHALPVEVDDEEESESVLKTLEAHWLVEEFMILTNKFVGHFLRSKLPNSTLLRCQDRPSDDQIKAWAESHPFIADILFHLQHKQISRERELRIEHAPNARYSNYIPVQKWVWAGIQEALDTENTTAAKNLLCTDQIHPEQALTYEEWISIQESAEYRCSASNQICHHFSLNVTNYLHFTSPIRRYQDLVVHRQLHSVLNDDEAPYSKDETIEFCSHINTITLHAKSYHKQCEILHLAHRLKRNPAYYNAFVQEVTDSGITIYIPGLRRIQKPQRTIQFNLLDVCSRPVLEEDIDLVRPGELGKRQRVVVKWQKRLYQFSGYHRNTKGDNTECVSLDPHQRTTFMRYKDWVPMLKTVLEHNDENLQELYDNICDDVNSGAFKDYVNSCRLGVTDVSSEVPKGLIIKHRCEFTLPLHIHQVVGVQMSAEPRLGKLVPVPQICDISNNFKCCLSHVDDPVKTLVRYATLPTKRIYKTLQEYNMIWLPIIEMESATNAVRNEDSVTISNIPIEFKGRQGKICNKSSYFDKRDIEFDAMAIEFWKPKTNREDMKKEEKEAVFVTMNSSDYVCIRCNVASPVKDRLLENIGHPESKMIWTGHGSFTKVRKKHNGQVDVVFNLHPKSPNPPSSSLQTTDQASLEIIQKSKVDKRTETYMKLLDFSSPVAKAIALGKKIPKLDELHQEIANSTRRDVPNMLPSNRQQWIAIDKALNSSFSLIQGPPGTGKTFTGIKLIYIFNEFNKQLREKTQSDRKQIVFCGPSNKSVDLVALWMKRKLGEDAPKMVRMYGKSYENLDFPVPGRALTSRRTMRRSKVDEQLSEEKVVLHWLIREPDRQYAEDLRTFDTKFKKNPEQVTLKDLKDYSKLLIDAKTAELKNHDVIFCTTSVAANPRFLQAVHGRIYQCIIDESGMCTEPESMVPIIGTQARQIVLIGDHKQLRPVVLCRGAVKLGLERSLFERYAIMDRYLTMLTKQYRMNPYICDFPSKTFYDGKLKTVLSKYWQVLKPLKIWPRDFQKMDDPVYGHMPHIFCHIEGEEEILTVSTEEGNEQSRSNKKEVQKVVKVFKHLMDVEKVNPDYINVISQYNAQCHAMKEAFLKEGLINIKINTVVASQGGEWDYVIFSTVRSLPPFLIESNPTEGWCKKNLGFITDHHQINVALTRARKGLIIIGNQNLLRCDEIWKKLIEDYRNCDCIKDASNFPTPRATSTIQQNRAPRFQRQRQCQLKEPSGEEILYQRRQ